MTSSGPAEKPLYNHVRSTSLRIIIPVALTLILFTLSVFFLFIPYVEEQLLAQKREMLRNLTDSCWSLVAVYHERVKSGALSQEEAQQRAIARLRELRYSPEGKDYFWINDMTPRMIMHPLVPDLEGKDLSGVTDAHGRHIFVELVKKVEEAGAGYIEYARRLGDDQNRTAPKISYVREFSPWGWVIGTGVYLEDVRANIKAITSRVALISSAILAVALALSLFSIWDALKTESARRRAEEMIREKEQEFQTLVEAAPFGISISDADEQFLYFNPKFTQLFGYTLSELPDKSAWFDRAYPDPLYRERVRATWVEDIPMRRGAGEAEPRVFTVRCKNGEDKVIHFRAVSMKNNRFLLAYQDITRSAKMEASLKESEQKYIQLYNESKRQEELYRSLLNSSADAIAIYDIEGRTQYVSPAFTRIFGWDMEEVKGKRIPFVPELEMEPTMCIIRSLVDDGTPCHGFETRRLTKDGRVLDVSLSSSRYDDHEGKPAGILVVLRDISERKALEAQFHEAQKMESIGILAGGVAHEFNNLLMVIQGNISLLLLDTEPGHPNCERLRSVEDHIKRGANLTRQLLGFARGGKYEISPTNMNDIVRKSADLFSRMKKDLHVHTDCPHDIRIIEADQGQLEQVLMNLYVNAGQAMPEGGDLHIATQNVAMADDQAVAIGLRAGNYVRVSVTDTGVGIDPDVLPRIFDPFFTTRGVGQGNGLGLASVYGIVKNHGGAITVRSVKGAGTTFDIYLPIADRAAPKPTETEEAPGIVHGMETILLVDDEEVILEMGKEILERLGYKVMTAANGKAALDAYRARQDHIALVILDMIMPDMTGMETYNRLREMNPAVAVLLSSGYSLDTATADVLKHGGNGFIQKPFNLAALSRKIREILKS